MIKYEYRSSQGRHGKPKLKTIEEMEGLAGFQTLFGFNEEVQGYIDALGATRGVGKYPLYMDRLYLDFDDNPAAEETTRIELKRMGLKHSIYDTGGRGKHIHVPVEPVERVGIAAYIKTIVKHTFPGADAEIYKPTGVIRLPGTYHSKTGQQMVLLEEIDGKVMNIDDYRPKGYVPVKPVYVEDDPAFLDLMLTRDLNTCVYEGGRNTHAFNIAATASKLKLDRDVLEELLMEWNATKCSPSLSETEIKTVINSAYRGGFR